MGISPNLILNPGWIPYLGVDNAVIGQRCGTVTGHRKDSVVGHVLVEIIWPSSNQRATVAFLPRGMSPLPR